MIINKELKIDLAHDYFNNPLRFHEGDVNGAAIVLSVFNNDTAFDLTGHTVKYDAVIAGMLAEQDASAAISGTNNNIVTVPVTPNMTALNGLLQIDVKFKKNDDILFLSTIKAYVERSIINNDTIIDISGTTIGQRLDALETAIDNTYSKEEVDDAFMELAPNTALSSVENIKDGQMFRIGAAAYMRTDDVSDENDYIELVNKNEVYTKSETDAMIPETYHKTIIDGDRYAWEKKTVSKDGGVATTNYCIRSSAISVGKNKEVIFTGNTTLHNTPCYAYVVEYDNSSFIKREQILTNSAIRLDDACKIVRFLYLHSSSTGVQMPVESKSSFSAVMRYPIDIPEFVDQTDSRISTLEDDLETIDTALSDMHISRFAGADSSWTNTFINKYGAATSMSTSIASDYVELDDNARKLAFTGSIVLSNEACIAYAVQYDENKGFITRSLLYAESTGHLSVVIPKSCKFVRFLYLHKSSTGVQMPLSANESFSILMQADSTGRDRSIPLGLHTMPENEGVLNLIRRCRQLTDIKWTPAVDLPRLLWNDDDYYEGVFKQGVEYTGIPYGRCVTYKSVYGKETTYVGSEIDYSTFVTAVSNPDSMICQESAYSHSDHRSVPYASVCSSLVCHALNVPYVDTSGISGISGLQNKGKIVNNGARMDLKTLKLGDVLNYSGYHVMVITDIITDDDGEVTYIEISEATPAGNDNRSVLDGQLGGLCRRIGYDSEAFYSRCKSYTVYRYLNIASIPYTKSAYVNVGDELDMKPYIHYPCMPYEGEGFIYESGHIPESKIKLLIDCHDTNGDNIYSHISIFKDGTELSGSPIALSAQQTYIEVMEIGAGEYTAYLSKIVDGSTVKSLSCHWSVREEGGE